MSDAIKDYYGYVSVIVETILKPSLKLLEMVILNLVAVDSYSVCENIIHNIVVI